MSVRTGFRGRVSDVSVFEANPKSRFEETMYLPGLVLLSRVCSVIADGLNIFCLVFG